LEVVGISDNPPEYLTISLERLKNFAQLIAFRSQYHTRPNGSVSEIRVDTTIFADEHSALARVTVLLAWKNAIVIDRFYKLRNCVAFWSLVAVCRAKQKQLSGG
jgi:hypothetical protein